MGFTFNFWGLKYSKKKNTKKNSFPQNYILNRQQRFCSNFQIDITLKHIKPQPITSKVWTLPIFIMIMQYLSGQQQTYSTLITLATDQPPQRGRERESATIK